MLKMYDYPVIYKIIHILLGLIIAIKKSRCILLLILLYQIFQYLLNVRLFLLDKNKVRSGNSIEHTVMKLGDYVIGYILGILYLYMKK